MKILIANIGSHALCRYILERSLPLRTTVPTKSCCSFWRAFSGYLPFEPLAEWLTQNTALQRLVSERPAVSEGALPRGDSFWGPMLDEIWAQIATSSCPYLRRNNRGSPLFQESAKCSLASLKCFLSTVKRKGGDSSIKQQIKKPSKR